MSTLFKVKTEDGTPVNHLIELLFLEHSELIDSAEKFEIATGASSLVSSGEPSQLWFTVKFPQKDKESIDHIIELQAIVRDFENTEGVKIIIEEIPEGSSED